MDLFEYDWLGRNGQRHRAEVLNFLGVRVLQEGDLDALQDWLETEIGRTGAEFDVMHRSYRPVVLGAQGSAAEPVSVATSDPLGDAALRGGLAGTDCGGSCAGNGRADGDVAERSPTRRSDLPRSRPIPAGLPWKVYSRLRRDCRSFTGLSCRAVC